MHSLNWRLVRWLKQLSENNINRKQLWPNTKNLAPGIVWHTRILRRYSETWWLPFAHFEKVKKLRLWRVKVWNLFNGRKVSQILTCNKLNFHARSFFARTLNLISTFIVLDGIILVTYIWVCQECSQSYLKPPQTGNTVS